MIENNKVTRNRMQDHALLTYLDKKSSASWEQVKDDFSCAGHDYISERLETMDRQGYLQRGHAETVPYWNLTDMGKQYLERGKLIFEDVA